jgi:RNA-binding protein
MTTPHDAAARGAGRHGALALSGAQKKFLRGRAHALEPLVQLGKQGLTEAILFTIDAELARHELIKIRVVGDRETKRAICAEIAERLACGHAGTVGHVAILYRPHPEPEKRRIELPE